MSDNIKVLIIGAGPIAIEYAKVLVALKILFNVVGRSKKSADAFEATTGIPVFTGSLQEYISARGVPDAAIVAVSMDQLAEVTNRLIFFGTKNILVEKPAGLNVGEVRKIGRTAQAENASVFVAYNRRFYASVIKALEIIQADGGVRSFHFEFTEWSHTVEKLEHAPGVLENWFLANSSHVVDMAFFLGGRPRKLSPYSSGGLAWHPAAIYSGAGVSEKGALFSYHANWCAPGRWMVEVMTSRHRLIFKPLEKLQLQTIGSLEAEFVDIDDSLDRAYKPGFYRQTEAFFFTKSKEKLLSIVEYLDLLSVYEEINNSDLYKSED